jgi:HK97 gp10 family phage protein
MPVDTRGFDRIRAGLPEAIERGIERGANLIADLARQLAPEKTGDLKRSIEVQDGAHALARRVVAGMPYAAFVEFGTRESEAQPYLTPARREIDVQAEVAIEVRKLVNG